MKRNEVLDPYNRDDSHRRNAERKKPVSKVAYCTLPFILHLRAGNIIATENRAVVVKVYR